MEMNPSEQKARKISYWFVAIAALLVVAVLLTVLLIPYDSGLLMGTALSGNNQQGGEIAYTNDYLFYVQNGQIMQYDKGNDTTKSIYTGKVSYLNPMEGWLYFVENGQIHRIAYYGGIKTAIGDTQKVTMMSVNGLWIYYLDEQGCLHKIRSDGEKHSQLTDGSIPFTAFESANRIILATDGTAIYQMLTDGTECQELCRGTNISMMLYTLDHLYYCDNGQIKRIQSVEAGQADGTDFAPLEATLFNYDVNDENRGLLYYVKDEQLYLRKLQSILEEHSKEEEVLLAKTPGITDLYSIDSDVFYHDQEGNFFRVRINQTECTVEPVGNPAK